MRRSSFALFVTVIGASILLSSTTTIDAAPVSRSSSSADTISSTTGAIVSHKHKHNKKHNKKNSNNNKLNKFLIPDAELSASSWYHRPIQRRNHPRALLPLEDHAVMDEEDDDAGNELLDTELDSGFERPDDDDTIEGEILEEEDLDDFDAIADGDDSDEEGVEGHLLQHTLRAANTAANVARAKAAGMAAAARARAVESLDWLKESEFEGEGEAVGQEEEVMKVVLSRFGGRAAAADMAAHAGEV